MFFWLNPVKPPILSAPPLQSSCSRGKNHLNSAHQAAPALHQAQPSFPRPRWRPFSVLVPPLALGSGGELTVKLLESDPLQPR